MTKSERTRAYIIEKTAPVFNIRGFEGASLAALCKATGLTKGALYGNFESKEELANAGFKFAVDRMRAVGSVRMDTAITCYDKLQAMLSFFAQYVINPPVKGGCPLLNTAVEADDARPSMKKVVSGELDRTVRGIVLLLEKGKRNGEFRRDFNARETALLFFCAIEGAIMFSRVSSSDEAMKAVVKNLERMLDGIRIIGKPRRRLSVIK